jgi:dUTP pyrophosphatase
MVPVLRFVKVSDKAWAPQRATPWSAGFDLRAAYDFVVPPRHSFLVRTDLQFAIPRGYYGRIAPRSGLALRHGIDVGAGVVDEDYRGEVSVLLFNHSDVLYNGKAGDRVAQLICQKICYPGLAQVGSLDQTDRNGGGFGSTGY